MKATSITGLTAAVLIVQCLVLRGAEGMCKAHDAKWKKDNLGPVISQPTRSDPTQVLVKWDRILDNARCVDKYTLFIWKEGETKERAQRIVITDKKTSASVSVDPCLSYSFQVEFEEDDWTHTDRELSGIAKFRTEAVSTLSNLDKKKFIVTYAFDNVRRHHDLSQAVIRFPRSLLKNPNCVLHIEVSGTELPKNNRPSTSTNTISSLVTNTMGRSGSYSNYPHHDGHYNPGSSGQVRLDGGSGGMLNGQSRSSFSFSQQASGRSYSQATVGSGSYGQSNNGGSGSYGQSGGSGSFGQQTTMGGSGSYGGSSNSGGSGSYGQGGSGGSGSYGSSGGSGSYGQTNSGGSGGSGSYGSSGGSGSSGSYGGSGGSGSYGQSNSGGSGSFGRSRSRPSIDSQSSLPVNGKVSPPFLRDIIEISVPIKSCNPYKFHLKIMSPRKAVIAEVKDIVLPQLSESKDFKPPKLSKVFDVETKYVNQQLTPSIKLRPNSGVPMLCLTDFFTAVDTHIAQLEWDLSYHIDKERQNEMKGVNLKKAIFDMQSSQLEKFGCSCTSPIIRVNTTDLKMYNRFKVAYGFYKHEGTQNGRPYYVRMSSKQGFPNLSGSSRPPFGGQLSFEGNRRGRREAAPNAEKKFYLYWDDSLFAWTIGEKMNKKNAYFRTAKKSTAKCPGDPQNAKKWQYSGTLSWKNEAQMQAACYRV